MFSRTYDWFTLDPLDIFKSIGYYYGIVSLSGGTMRENRETKQRQMAMARKVAKLKTKEAKRAQVHRLVESLKQSIRGKQQ